MNENIVVTSKIIDALQVIKNECKAHSRCSYCPFYTDDTCRIKYVDPEKWQLESNYIWRAFK